MDDFSKAVTILLMFSPVFILVIGLSILLIRGIRVLEKYKEYWLVSSVLYACLYGYGLITHQISSWNNYYGLVVLSGLIGTYAKLNSRSTKTKLIKSNKTKS